MIGEVDQAAIAASLSKIKKCMEEAGIDQNRLNNDLGKVLHASGEFCQRFSESATKQVLHNHFVNAPSGILPTETDLAGHALRDGLSNAIAGLYGWSDTEIIALCGSLLEEANAHEESAVVLSFLPDANRAASFRVRTYRVSEDKDGYDYTEAPKMLKVAEEDGGVRLVFGDESDTMPDLHVERQPGGKWSLLLHIGKGDPVVGIAVGDDGRVIVTDESRLFSSDRDREVLNIEC